VVPKTTFGDNFKTFLGQPRQEDLGTLSADFAVLGIPFGSPYHIHGVASGACAAPAAIRAKSNRFGGMMDHHDFDFDDTLLGGNSTRIVDCGDVFADPRTLEDNKRRATAAVAAILQTGAVPIVLGGDDSIPAMVLGAYEDYGPITVLQFDAHLDYRDEVHGIRDGYSSPMRRAAEMEWVERIVHVGMRGVGSARPQDVADSRAAGNAVITARQVRAEGVGCVLNQLPDGGNVFITIDCDGFDPAVMPGTSAPVPGGLDYWEGADILTGAVKKCRVVGLDTAEHFPSLDLHGITSLALTRLIATLIGAMARR